MSEVKKFPGQPVLSQILNVIPNSIINAANRKHQSNRYYKRLPQRDQDAGVLCVDCSTPDGCNPQESSDKEIVCQYDHRNPLALNELCRVAGIY